MLQRLAADSQVAEAGVARVRKGAIIEKPKDLAGGRVILQSNPRGSHTCQLRVGFLHLNRVILVFRARNLQDGPDQRLGFNRFYQMCLKTSQSGRSAIFVTSRSCKSYDR
jgi:hypothetical protein